MPLNHIIPIENAGLWDILDWNVLVGLSRDADGDPRDPGKVLPFVAKRLIEGGARAGHEDEEFFHQVVTRFVGVGKDADRRQRAGELALLLGAKPDRLIEFVAYKWGLFKRRGPSAK